MKTKALLLLMVIGYCGPILADTNILAAGAWSEPASDADGYKLRARLLICEAPRHRGTRPGPDAAVYLELQECSDFLGATMEVYCNMKGDVALGPDFRAIEKAGGVWKVEDESGKPLSESGGGYGGPDVTEYWIQMPCDSTVRLRCSNWGDGRLEDGRLRIFLQNHCWVIPSRGTNHYFMSGTFNVSPPTYHVEAPDLHVWRGTLIIPKMRITGGEPAWPVDLSRDKVVLSAESMTFRRVSPLAYGINVGDFFLLETEVTNDMYRRFLESTGKLKGDRELAASEKERWEKQIRSGTLTSSTADPVYDLRNPGLLWSDNRPPRGKGDYPVTLVTIGDAEEFCHWLNQRYADVGTFRLPTKEEWLIAAYGGGKRNYPWGEKWDARIPYVSRSEEAQRSSPIGVHSPTRDITPEGVRHLWGNVREYVQNPWGSPDVFWMGPSFKAFQHKEGWPFKPKQGWWGYVHNSQSRMEDTGFRVLLVRVQ